MNKYQEALQWVPKYNASETLKELVNRATLMKPIKVFHLGKNRLGCKCGDVLAIDKPPYCANCGQALDWSNQ